MFENGLKYAASRRPLVLAISWVVFANSRVYVRSWPKAGPEIHGIPGNLASALPSEADIELILVKGSANDP